MIAKTSRMQNVCLNLRMHTRLYTLYGGKGKCLKIVISRTKISIFVHFLFLWTYYLWWSKYNKYWWWKVSTVINSTSVYFYKTSGVNLWNDKKQERGRGRRKSKNEREKCKNSFVSCSSWSASFVKVYVWLMLAKKCAFKHTLSLDATSRAHSRSNIILIN